MPVGLSEPMSEEFAMAGLSPTTHYQAYFFPSQRDQVVRRSVMFEGISKSELINWRRTYLSFLQKISADCNGKQLLLKNPTHTARIRELIRMFPRQQVHPCLSQSDLRV